MKKSGYLSALFLVLMLAACGGGGSSGDNGTTVTGPGIYVAGYYTDESRAEDSIYVSCVWKLTESGVERIELTKDSAPESICVYNNKVYVSGVTNDPDTGSTIPCCWVISSDGKVTRYDLDGMDAPSIAVYNGTAYIAGSYETATGYTACYWTIDSSGSVTRTDLAPENASYILGNARSIFVNADAIYIAGDYSTGIQSDDVACYWEIKKAAAAELTAKSSSSTASGITPSHVFDGQMGNSIVVKDGTIYVAGGLYSETVENGITTATFTGVYWICNSEGCTRYDLNEDLSTYAETIGVGSDNTVYTAGKRKVFYPCYWTGTAITALGTQEGEVNSICISGGTLYMAGNYKGKNNSVGSEVACLWMGSVRTDITDLADDKISGANATAVFVYE